MGEGCPERFDWSFIKWVMAFNKPGKSRDVLLEQIELHGGALSVNPATQQAAIAKSDERTTAEVVKEREILDRQHRQT